MNVQMDGQMDRWTDGCFEMHIGSHRGYLLEDPLLVNPLDWWELFEYIERDSIWPMREEEQTDCRCVTGQQIPDCPCVTGQQISDCPCVTGQR